MLSTTAAICGGYAGLCVLSWLYTALVAPGFRVAGKHVFITGGSSGLGLSLAKQYARAGAKVTIVARDAERLAAAKRAIESSSSSDRKTHAVLTIACDVRDFATVQRAVDEANAFHERITDHVVCNAGVTDPGLFLDQDICVFRALMDTNYFGALHTVKAALPAMVDAPRSAAHSFKRRVVFINSGVGLLSFIGYAQYSASKYALRGLSDALRNELKLYDIETSVFYPGSIDTPMLANEKRHKPEETTQIEGVADVATADAAAIALLAGIASGHYAITNEPILTVARAFSNGVAPRVNTPLELALMPVFVLVQMGYLLFVDYVVGKAARQRRHA